MYASLGQVSHRKYSSCNHRHVKKNKNKTKQNKNNNNNEQTNKNKKEINKKQRNSPKLTTDDQVRCIGKPPFKYK